MSPAIATSSTNSEFNIGHPFIELQQIPSTNSYAIDNIQANLAAPGTAYFAHAQTSGKGQRGKIWITEPGTNIILSVVLNTACLSAYNKFPLSMTVALACYDFFNKYATEDTTIKWPNDLYWRDRKAAGILIENILRGETWPWAVAGMGMNINQTVFDPTTKNPVSLKQITGNHFNTVEMAKELCVCLNNRYNQLLEGDNNSLLEEYNSKLYKYKQPVKLKKDNIVFNCIIEGVSPLGDLLVSGAAQDHFVFGEVEWVI